MTEVPAVPTGSNSLTGWRSVAGWTAAVPMAAMWLVAGFWKLSNLSGFELMLTQLLFPVEISLALAVAVAICEVFTGVLLLRPAWRRWGGLLSVGLLGAFMAYMAWNYETLQGEDCSCFPWLERAVGPEFFWSDAAMVAVALVAVWLAPAARGLRGAAAALGCIVVLGGAALAVDQMSPVAASAVPESIQVEGSAVSLREGRVFLYFFNPTCLHCLDAGMAMSELEWDAKFVGIPTQDFEFAPGFVEDSGLQNVLLTEDLEPLKETFPFEDVPYAVALEDGQVERDLRFFEEPELSEKLRALGFIR